VTPCRGVFKIEVVAPLGRHLLCIKVPVPLLSNNTFNR
jgi:hypothetical protein